MSAPTFAGSMLERVIEERAEGDTTRARAIRERIGAMIGDRLGNVRPGSEEAAQVKSALIAEGIWSQYLEVGIRPLRRGVLQGAADVCGGLGHAPVGLHPDSNWNNPEPEIVLAVASDGRINGGRRARERRQPARFRRAVCASLVTLSKAKDNNASPARPSDRPPAPSSACSTRAIRWTMSAAPS